MPNVITRELEDKLNNYMLEVHKKLGKLPHGVRTKLGRMALEEWFKRHGNDFDIDWDSREQAQHRKSLSTSFSYPKKSPLP